MSGGQSATGISCVQYRLLPWCPQCTAGHFCALAANENAALKGTTGLIKAVLGIFLPVFKYSGRLIEQVILVRFGDPAPGIESCSQLVPGVPFGPQEVLCNGTALPLAEDLIYAYTNSAFQPQKAGDESLIAPGHILAGHLWHRRCRVSRAGWWFCDSLCSLDAQRPSVQV